MNVFQAYDFDWLMQKLETDQVTADRLLQTLESFNHHEVQVMHRSISEAVIKLQHSSNVDDKFESMVALRMYFGTLEYTTVVLVEIYALPVITRLLTDSVSQNVITSSKGTGNNGLQLPEYFFDLAIEFVSNCAQVKPFRTVQHREMSEPSQFYKAAMQLRHKKINPKQQEVFYPAKYAVQARKIFQAKLLNFDPSEYNIFFVSLVDQEIHQNRHQALPMKAMLDAGEQFLSVALLQHCETQLDHMEPNFETKYYYLKIVSGYIENGQIEGLATINSCAFMKDICRAISEVQGEQGLDAGKDIYPSIRADPVRKKQFYVAYLSCLELWAQCVPEREAELSEDNSLYNHLSKHRRFVFPDKAVPNEVLKYQIRQRYELNSKRNAQMVKLLSQETIPAIKAQKPKLVNCADLQLPQVQEWQMPLEEVEKSADLIMDSVLHKKPRKIKKIKSKGIVQLNQVHSPCLSEVYPLNETIQSKEVREIQLLPSEIPKFQNQIEPQPSANEINLLSETPVYESYIPPLEHQPGQGTYSRPTHPQKADSPKKENCEANYRLQDNYQVQPTDQMQLCSHSFEQHIYQRQPHQVVSEQGQTAGEQSLLQAQEIERSAQPSYRPQPIHTIVPSPLYISPPKVQQSPPIALQDQQIGYYRINYTKQSKKNTLNQPKERVDPPITTHFQKDVSQVFMRKMSGNSPQPMLDCPQPSLETPHKPETIPVGQSMTFDKQSNSPPSTVNFKDVMEPSKLIVLPLDRLGVLKESRKKDKIVEFLCSPRSRASPDSAFGGSRSNFRPPSIDNFKSTNLLLRENGKRNGVGHSSPKGQFSYGLQTGSDCQILSEEQSKKFFPSEIDNDYRLKRAMLRLKSLLFKSDSLQIGCLTMQEDQNLTIIVYLTACGQALHDIEMGFESNQGMAVECSVSEIRQIKQNKQKQIPMHCRILKTPYNLPELLLGFTEADSRQRQQLRVPLPASYNKFCQSQPASGNLHMQGKKVGTQEFKLTSKLSSEDKIKDYLPNFQLLWSKTTTSMHATECLYKNNTFLIKLAIAGGRIAMVSGQCSDRSDKGFEQLKFLVGTYRVMLERE